METQGGGWTVLQHRRNGSVDFHRGWRDYKTVGFACNINHISIIKMGQEVSLTIHVCGLTGCSMGERLVRGPRWISCSHQRSMFLHLLSPPPPHTHGYTWLVNQWQSPDRCFLSIYEVSVAFLPSGSRERWWITVLKLWTRIVDLIQLHRRLSATAKTCVLTPWGLI